VIKKAKMCFNAFLHTNDSMQSTSYIQRTSGLKKPNISQVTDWPDGESENRPIWLTCG
jgi:hypothetical protein